MHDRDQSRCNHSVKRPRTRPPALHHQMRDDGWFFFFIRINTVSRTLKIRFFGSMNLVKVRYIIEDSLTKIKVTLFLYSKKIFSLLNPNIFYVNGRDANRHPIIGKIHVKIVHSLSLFLYLSHTHARSRARSCTKYIRVSYSFLFSIFFRNRYRTRKTNNLITNVIISRKNFEKNYILHYMEICINDNLHKATINIQFSFIFDSIFKKKKIKKNRKKKYRKWNVTIIETRGSISSYVPSYFYVV